MLLSRPQLSDSVACRPITNVFMSNFDHLCVFERITFSFLLSHTLVHDHCYGKYSVQITTSTVTSNTDQLELFCHKRGRKIRINITRQVDKREWSVEYRRFWSDKRREFEDPGGTSYLNSAAYTRK